MFYGLEAETCIMRRFLTPFNLHGMLAAPKEGVGLGWVGFRISHLSRIHELSVTLSSPLFLGVWGNECQFWVSGVMGKLRGGMVEHGSRPSSRENVWRGSAQSAVHMLGLATANSQPGIWKCASFRTKP